MIMIASGIIAIIVGAVYRPNIIQFMTPLARPSIHELTWRINRSSKPESLSFIKEVQKQITKADVEKDL